MREFIYYSRTAPTAGYYIKEDLQASGRIDIAVHAVIASFFLSHKIRTDTRLHLIFAGPPDPVKHLELFPKTDGKVGVDKIYLGKKDVSGILRKMLFKYRKDLKHEVFPGYWVEKKNLVELIGELRKQGKTIYVLDPDGEDIRKIEIKDNPVFLLGDHKGIPQKDYKRLLKICKSVMIGPKTYFASHTLMIVQNELDRRGI